MKSKLIHGAIMLAMTASVFAGTDMAGSHTDTKDMKNAQITCSSDGGFYVAVEGGARFATDYGDNRQTITGGSASSTQEIHST
jgi:hypothetical protein